MLDQLGPTDIECARTQRTNINASRPYRSENTATSIERRCYIVQQRTNQLVITALNKSAYDKIRNESEQTQWRKGGNRTK